MTNNEAAKWIQLYIDLAKIDPTTGEAAYLNEDARKTLEAMGMAVDALISKQAAEDRAIEELPSAQPETHDKRTKTHSCDCINRKDAIDAHYEYCNKHPDASFPVWSLKILEDLPSAQPDRDIPVKPVETTDKTWGIPLRQAVCPKCDYYLGHVAFLGDYKGKRITYCETCGQAIDWEGWEFDE